jgi:hypothetical protein
MPMERSPRSADVLRILAAPCLSFGPLFIAIGAENKSLLEHFLVMGGAVMLGLGLSALLTLTAKIEHRLAALQEQPTSAKE